MCETRGSHVAYSEVTVEEVSNGYSVYKYKNYDNGYSDHALKGFVSNQLEDVTGGGVVDFRQNSEGISMALERGQLLTQKAYDSNKVIRKEIVNTYNDDPNRFNEHVRYLSYTPLSINMTGYKYHSVSAGVYYTYFPYLKEKMEIDYQDGGTITKTVNYEYDTKYRLLKSIQITNSNQRIHKKNYYYPHENRSVPIYNQMVEKHLLSYPVKEVVQAGGKSTTVYHHYADGLAAENPNLILKESDSSQVGDGAIFTETSYRKYDAIGNPNEIDYRTEGKSCYLWSYNKTYPVANISGISFEEVKAILGAYFIKNLENSIFPSEDNIQTIRTNLAGTKAQITTYTYQPLIGVTSTTQPNGVKLIYEYDALGRLLTVKDTNGKTVERYKYHYANSIY